jgi:hypothetical protein
VGQPAHDTLDTDPARTSSLIQSGTIDAEVTKLIQDVQQEAYEVKLDYHFQIEFMGNQDGTKTTNIDATYFTPEFLENLRKTGSYVGPNFKAKHLGYEDAKNLDGKFYPHCDKIELYDIKQSSGLGALGRTLLAAPARADIKDLKIFGHIYEGVPVIGAVKLDASGNYDGMDIKAGGDYEPTN